LLITKTKLFFFLFAFLFPKRKANQIAKIKKSDDLLI
jgi:hypothetical protein